MQWGNFIKRIIKTVNWIGICFLTLLLTHNALQYFRFDTSYGILGESIMKDSSFYLVLFYTHLLTGTLCITTPIFQFIIRVTGNSKKGHHIIGHLFTWTTLVFVVPTGIYLAFFAKGGLVTQIGFIVQGLIAGHTTYRGYKAGRSKSIQTHIQWMIRAYAAVSIVLTFRLLHVIFYHLQLPYETNYEASQWIGIMLNLCISELLIERMNTKSKRSLKLQSS